MSSRLLLLLILVCCAGLARAQEANPLDPALLPPQLQAQRAARDAAGSLALPAAPAVSAPDAVAAPMVIGATLAAPFDYSANLASDVFGAQLFTGSFAREGAARFNPDYAVAVGDRVQIRLWGGFDYDSMLEVDPKGNLFLPHVGPVQVLGVRNEDLQRVVESAVARVFRANVYSYASLAAAQPVRIYVSGFVNRPGLYDGTSLDSLLHYLDQAGGIDPERGSFLGVQVKRGEAVRAEVNLYEFLLEGRMPLVQLADGDVIFVGPRRNIIAVTGLAQNARRFEFSSPQLSVAELARLARPQPEATHARVVRNTGSVQNVEYYSLDEAENVALVDGDRLEFTADKKPGTITVRVEGEHQSPQEYVLPYGTRMGDLIGRIQFSDRSDVDGLQLFRRSVKERQKQMLQTALKSLETAALTARSGTSDEARLRTEEANLLLRWVDRAREVEPLGQVMMVGSANRDQLLLENGDVLRVPVRDGLVLISGEVLFPNAIAWEDDLGITDYVDRAGGFTQNADASRIVIAHRNGSFEEATSGSGLFRKNDATNVLAGDEILVLPKIDVKSRQIWKDMTQILYQIAVAAKVVVDL